MTVLGWVLLAGVIAAAMWVQYTISRSIDGPSHCMGCGKCSETGICVLTGKPVGPRRTKPGGEHLGTGPNSET